MPEAKTETKAPPKFGGEFVVTGRQTGTDAIKVDGKRYAPGDKVILKGEHEWLEEQGYVATASSPAGKKALGKTGKKTKRTSKVGDDG